MSIDLARIDLAEVITTAIGPPEQRRGAGTERPWWRCPFHSDGNPSLSVTPDKKHWRCFGCGETGDAIDFIRKHDPSLSFSDALRQLNVPLSSLQEKRRGSRGSRGSCFSVGSIAPLLSPPRAQWQRDARRLVKLAEGLLWSAEGSDALQWLRDRGLSRATIKAAGLGYDPIRKGVMIPWFHRGKLRKVNIRNLEGKPKYRNLEGSVGGVLYPDGFPLPGKPLLLVEGEFDCLLLRQKVGRLLQVVTLGSTSSQPTAEALTALSFGSPFLVGLDADDAGNKAAGVWATLAPRSKRLRTPKGKDWTEAYLAGVNLREWSASQLKKH